MSPYLVARLTNCHVCQFQVVVIKRKQYADGIVLSAVLVTVLHQWQLQLQLEPEWTQLEVHFYVHMQQNRVRSFVRILTGEMGRLKTSSAMQTGLGNVDKMIPSAYCFLWMTSTLNWQKWQLVNLATKYGLINYQRSELPVDCHNRKEGVSPQTVFWEGRVYTWPKWRSGYVRLSGTIQYYQATWCTYLRSSIRAFDLSRERLVLENVALLTWVWALSVTSWGTPARLKASSVQETISDVQYLFVWKCSFRWLKRYYTSPSAHLYQYHVATIMTRFCRLVLHKFIAVLTFTWHCVEMRDWEHVTTTVGCIHTHIHARMHTHCYDNNSVL